MEVFVIPLGPAGGDRYELYCEPSADPEADVNEPDADGGPVRTGGLIGRLRHRFSVMLRAAEDRQSRRRDFAPESKGWLWRLQDRALGWVAQRIAEQRLLWKLRREMSAVAVHPEDMTLDEVMALIRRTLQRDYERHRRWLIVDALGLAVSTPLAIAPGPNVIAYYFAFRVVGHWLSMRGATHGITDVSWSGRPCPPLAELRDVVLLEPSAREARILDVAARLRLPHLTTFFDRVAVRHA